MCPPSIIACSNSVYCVLYLRCSSLAQASTIYLSSAPSSINCSSISSARISVSLIFLVIVLCILASYFPNRSVIIRFCVSSSARAKFARNSLALCMGLPSTSNCSVGTVMIYAFLSSVFISFCTG